MSRKKFIESQGATCRNWTWSWSFINEAKKVVIFGAWDTNTDGDTSLILSDTWKVSGRGRKQPAYEQSREHIRLIEEEGYELQTFPLIYSDGNKDEDGIGPAKIEGFVPELSKKLLKKVGGKWYASDGEMSNQLPEEVDDPEQYIEGASKTVSVNIYVIKLCNFYLNMFLIFMSVSNKNKIIINLIFHALISGVQRVFPGGCKTRVGGGMKSR